MRTYGYFHINATVCSNMLQLSLRLFKYTNVTQINSIQDAKTIFRDTSATFSASLSQKWSAYRPFRDAQSMLDSVRNQFETHPIHASRCTRIMEPITRLADKLSPFFGIIGIFVSSHPEYAALAWGSIRLVLLVYINVLFYALI